MKSKTVGLLILFIIAITCATGFYLALIPPFEGINTGLEGAEINDTFYRIDTANDNMPGGYWWMSRDPRASTLYKKTQWWLSEGAIRFEIQPPQLVSDPYTEGREVNYWVQEAENSYIHVKGQINIYRLHMTVSVVNTGKLNQDIFSGEKLWVALVSIAWNRALQEQSPYTGNTGYGQAWEAPIALIIEEFEVRQAGDFGKIEPSVSGRWITLYTDAEQSGTVSDLGIPYGANINTTLSGDVRPDSRLKSTAFFAVTLTSFGTSEKISGTYCPVADYTLKLYSIQIGRYTYTNPDDTPWGEREEEGKNWWDTIGQWWGGVVNWFTNPLNQIWVFFIILVVVVIIVSIMSPGLWTVLARSRRKK